MLPLEAASHAPSAALAHVGYPSAAAEPSVFDNAA